MNVAGGSVILHNYGTLSSLNATAGGAQAVDFSAITSVGSSSSDGVDFQNNSGAQITNYATGTITGGSILGSNGSGINLDGFNNKQLVTIVNSGTIDGSSSGRAIDMGGGNNTLNIVGGQAIVLGDVNGGSGGTNAVVIHPGAGNGFSYSGSLSNVSTVEVQSGTVTLSGISTYSGSTNIRGGKLMVDGSNRLASSSALALNGGTLKLANSAGGNGQTFSTLLLGADSSIELGGSSLTFNALGTIASGRTLTLFDYVMSTTPGYAIRILGDVTGNGNF